MVPRLGFHGLRVAAATELHAAGATIRDLMDALHWKSEQMPMRYVRSDRERGEAALARRATKRADAVKDASKTSPDDPEPQ